MFQWKSGDLSARKAPVAASPAKPTKPTKAFAPLAFGAAGKQRAKSAAPVASTWTSKAGRDAETLTKANAEPPPFVTPTTAFPKSRTKTAVQGVAKPPVFKFAALGGKGRLGLSLAKPAEPTDQVAPPPRRFQSPPVQTGFTSRGTTSKPSAKLPQAFSWGGSTKGGTSAPVAPVFTGFRPLVPRPGNTTPKHSDQGLRKVPAIPTLLTPTSASAAKKAVNPDQVFPEKTSGKRPPRDESARPGKRPKAKHMNGISRRHVAEMLPPQSVIADRPGALKIRPVTEQDQTYLQEPGVKPVQDSNAGLVTEDGDFSCEIPMGPESTYAKPDLASEITLISVSPNVQEDEGFLEQIQRMHIEIDQTEREEKSARDRLLQTHADLSESLLDAITDLIAESGGCGLDQLSIDEDASDSIDADMSNFHTMISPEQPCATTSSA